MRNVTPMNTPIREKPLFIFCDQITWSASRIASKNGTAQAASSEIMDVFASLYQQGQNVIMVTHEADIAACATRIVRFRDGHIESDEWNRRRRFVHAAGPGVLP